MRLTKYFKVCVIMASVSYAPLRSQAQSPDEAVNDTVPVTELEEIVVKTSLTKREADRIVLNIAADPLAANKDAQQLLTTAPGVWATNENISIYGQDGTTVYVDDRKINMSGSQLMTYLKSIRSSQIATIEIIPKAGAEYSSDSSGGVILINLRRNRIDGVNGSAGLNVTAGEYKQWYNPYCNFGLHSGKWTVNWNGSLNGSPSERYTSHEESTNELTDRRLTGVAKNRLRAFQGNTMIGVFFEPAEEDRLGLQLSYDGERKHTTSDSRTEAFGNEPESLTEGRYDRHERFNNFNATFNWIHTLDNDGSLLKVIANYNFQNSTSDEDNRMTLSESGIDSLFRSASSNRYNILTADGSLRKVFNDNWKLEVGVKYTFNDVLNRSSHKFLNDGSWIADEGLDYDSKYSENISAVYALANGSTGRWKFRFGLRGEYFHVSGNETTGSRFDLFPNANVSFAFTEAEDYSVALGYYRNIRRPLFRSLDPTVRQVSDYSYTVGNPGLKPSFNDGLSLDFILAGKFTIATGYSETRDPISQVFSSNPDYPERMYLTWANGKHDRNMFIHGDGRMSLTKWWSLYAGATYIRTWRKFSDMDSDRFGYVRLVTSTTFMFPRDWNLTVNVFYNTTMKIGNITVYPLLNVNPTIQKRFGRHWVISAGVEDMLQRRSRLRIRSTDFNRLNYTKLYAVARITATYTFSAGNPFRSQRVEKSTDDSRLARD